MHDGAFKTLEEVVEFMNNGGSANPNLSGMVKPLNLTAEEKGDLVAFLKALTGETIKVSLPKLPK
jgi:cytochrome c peroxidase